MIFKSLLFLVALTAGLSQALAQNCFTADGVEIQNGAMATLYYVQRPRIEIGPNYTCVEISRERACINGQLSVEPRECSDYDSGGCSDSWLAQLPDDAFTYGTCRDSQKN